MKCLKIDRGRGYFLGENGDYVEIDGISKEDLLRLLNIAISTDESFELDQMDDELIKNEAHRIIYRNLSNKFLELISNRNRFIDESEAKYKEALKKYSE